MLINSITTIKNPYITTPAKEMCVKQRIGGYIESDHLDVLPVTHETKGSWGPLAWDIRAIIDKEQIIDSSFYIKISFHNNTIINSTFDKNHPSLDVDYTISGVGVKLEVGISFEEERIYLKGILDFKIYKKEIDITLLKF